MKHYYVLSPLVAFLFILLLSSPVAVQAASRSPKDYCEADGDCASDRWCNKAKTPNNCDRKRGIGKPCNRDVKCLSGCCGADETCVSCDGGDRPSPDDPDVGDPCDGVTCSGTKYCFEGQCIKRDKCYGVTCPDGSFCKGGRCERERPNGSRCNANYKCRSGYCDYFTNTCIPCPPGLTCPLPPGPGRECNNNFDCAAFGLLEYCDFISGTCRDYSTVGERCSDDFQCFSGFCNPYEFPRRCRRRRALGADCTYDEQCASRNCDNLYEACKYLFLFEWDCSTNTCVPGVGEGRIGDYCSKDYQCQQDKCYDDECKENGKYKGPGEGAIGIFN